MAPNVAHLVVPLFHRATRPGPINVTDPRLSFFVRDDLNVKSKCLWNAERFHPHPDTFWFSLSHIKAKERNGGPHTTVFSLMSSIVFTRQARAFYHASDIPDEVWRALSENEAAANVILPFAKKAKKLPRGHDGQFWIALYNGTNNVEFVLSCTRGPLGNYPIFIVPSKASARHAQEGQRDKDLADSLLPLVRCLLDKVDHPDRIFSIFSIARVTEKFAEIFQAEVHARQHHDIQAHKDPYYDATFTFCTSETFNESLRLEFPLRGTEDITISLRRADKTHLEGIKALCKAFSETSVSTIFIVSTYGV